MGRGKGQTVIEIHRLALGPFPIEVDEHQLITGVLVEQGIGVAHPYHAGAHQHHFAVVF